MTRPRPPLPPAAAPPSARSEAPGEPPCLASEQLFRDGNEVLIEHRGEIYRLRLTRQDKLILTK